MALFASLAAFRPLNALAPLRRLVRPLEGRLRVSRVCPRLRVLALESELGEGRLSRSVQCFFGDVCAFSGRFDGENLDTIFDLW